jgi:hypothetical protein
MNLILRALSVICLAACICTAQDKPIRGASIQYSTLVESGDELHGWQAEWSWNRTASSTKRSSVFAVGFDVGVSDHFGRREDIADSVTTRSNVRRTTGLVGIRVFPWLPWFPGYVRALGGYSRRTSTADDGAGASLTRSWNSPTVGIGTGIVIPIREHVILRPIDVTFVHFFGSNPAPNGLRVSAGVSLAW